MLKKKKRLPLLLRFSTPRRTESKGRQPRGLRALELIELFLTAAEQVLDVEEILLIHLLRVAAELGDDDRLDAAAVVGGLGASSP